MANLEKYKEAARKFEQKEQWPKAIEALVKAIEEFEKSPENDSELALYNRVGDLYAKVGDTTQAIQYYERAVDRYSEAGLVNNAIALANKVLRLSPGRAQGYLKLGMLFAQKGFMAEAKTNLLEYAGRMQKAGQLEEAFRALKKFAEMTPGQDDIWKVLADQARAEAKTPEQKEQIERLLSEFDVRDKAVTQRRSRMSRSMITGEVIPEEPGPKKGELVFLDLDDVPTPGRRSAPAVKPPVEEPPAPPPPEPEPQAEVQTLDIEQTAIAGSEDMNIEPTSLVVEPTSLGVEPTSLVQPEAESGSAGADLPLLDVGAGAETPGGAADLPLLDEGGAGLELEMPADAPIEAEPAGAALEFMDLGDVEVAAPSADDLASRIAANPQDWDAHRAYGEALIEKGAQEQGLAELDIALDGYDGAEQYDLAYAVNDEILRLQPNSIRHQQKRVELSYRQGDRQRLVDAYVELADALLRSNEPDKAIAVYQRVLEHDPGNVRARTALETLMPVAPAPSPAPAQRVSVPKAAAPAADSGDYVDLGALLLDEEETQKDTRMRIEDEEPTGDEQKDFQAMLAAFKKGIEANVGEEDFQSHYDLGVAYKEMGLLDEAIAEFQKALRSTEGRLKSSEALGLCFFEKGQFAVAEAILRRGLELPASGDAERIGLLYWLGRTLEELGKSQEALSAYNRVFAVDITFADVGDRVNALSRAGV